MYELYVLQPRSACTAKHVMQNMPWCAENCYLKAGHKVSDKAAEPWHSLEAVSCRCCCQAGGCSQTLPTFPAVLWAVPRRPGRCTHAGLLWRQTSAIQTSSVKSCVWFFHGCQSHMLSFRGHRAPSICLVQNQPTCRILDITGMMTHSMLLTV